MGSCYLEDHIAEDHIHTDKTTYNIKEQQHKYALKLAVLEYWGGGGAGEGGAKGK